MEANSTTPPSLAPHTCIRRVVGDGGGGPNSEKYVSVAGGASDTIRYSFSAQSAFEKAMYDFRDSHELFLEGFSRWGKATDGVGYTALLDHASPRLGRAQGDANSVEDGDNYALTNGGIGKPGESELFVYIASAGHNILRRRVRFSSSPPSPPPAPPPAPPAECNTLLVSGAGRGSANGLYHRLPPSNSSDGCPIFQKANAEYQIHRTSDPAGTKHFWRLVAQDEVGGLPALYDNQGEGKPPMPPTSGWTCTRTSSPTGGARVLPAPAFVVCQSE
jgi:hypothetical protein